MDYWTNNLETGVGSIFLFPLSSTLKEQEQYERTRSEFQDVKKAEHYRLISHPCQELSYHVENAIR